MTDEPISFTRKKALRTGNMDDWTVRDVLVDLIEDIDNGIVKPTEAVIIYRETYEDGSSHTRFTQSGPNLVTTLGMMEIAKSHMLVSE